MKKIAVLLALLIIITNWIPITNNSLNSYSGKSVHPFTLPASLTVIEDEAFEGIAAEKIVLAESVAFIGERTFSNIFVLRDVFIPESVLFIADNAFEGASYITIRGQKNSFAEHWALQHNYVYVSIDNITAWRELFNRLIQGYFLFLSSLNCMCPNVSFIWRRRKARSLFSLRPQDRPELHPIDLCFP